ncbi:LPP20 family lipoprotein [Selenomonas ruminantium]|uniref:LPP20 family lipoprotein n=1 Tax=Selenomonas ruminantium TaxID=971 RepID=UPI00047D966F|nr:LPP20 family lipoprotein [Selenomonas ruminantium]
MNRLMKVFGLFGLMVMLLVSSMATVLAAENVDWNKNVIRATGGGVAPAGARTLAQARMMARRAAITDAYRQLAEYVGGVNVDSETTVDMAAVQSDVIKTRVQATIRGARIVSEGQTGDGGYEVTMEVPLFGVSSLASAVIDRPATIESFPEQTPDVLPSVVEPYSEGGWATPAPRTSTGSSAAPAPDGKAIGTFTGLIVDCRGLGLKPVMSPVIKNANGRPIYGYKNLDYDKVIEKGMAAYAWDMSGAARAGRNPLIVRALAVENHGGTPVLSVADANRVLIENGATHFLDDTNVVFLR